MKFNEFNLQEQLSCRQYSILGDTKVRLLFDLFDLPSIEHHLSFS